MYLSLSERPSFSRKWQLFNPKNVDKKWQKVTRLDSVSIICQVSQYVYTDNLEYWNTNSESQKSKRSAAKKLKIKGKQIYNANLM